MTPLHATCLCDTVAWEVTAPLEMMHHCHCSRCRKAHGTGFATFAMCAASGVRVTRGRDEITTYESSPGVPRAFCRRCGSVAPSDAVWNGQVGIPVGPLEGDPGERPMAHIFAASKAPWLEIAGDLPRFEAYPPGVDAAVQPDLASSGGAGGPPRGSCLCGAVAFVVTGEPLRCQHCHCMR